MSKGLLIVVSAPSGCGKGTILAQVLKNDNFYYSVSATTRSPREGEVDGVNYHFLTKEGFEKLIAEDGMLEHACYCGNYYGTPKAPVEESLAAGQDVLLEIEVTGAKNIRTLAPEATLLFVIPPSMKELRRRLEHTFFLVPGYGAQGGTAADVRCAFDELGRGAIVNASRSSMCAWKKTGKDGMDYQEAARAAAEQMRDELREYITIL